MLHICGRIPAGNLECGTPINVLERQEQWVKFTLQDGIERYIDRSFVSSVEDRFRPFADETNIPSAPAPNCPTHTNRAARVVSLREADYTDDARKAHVEGTVVLSITIDKNGKPRNIKVERKLGHGLEGQAIAAVKNSQFEPAQKDGQPIESTIRAEFQFHISTWK